MPTPKGPVWPLDPHTGAKHAILREYLRAWFPILAQASHIPRFTYAEGFAGPGIYEGGEPGSPIIALEEFLDQQELLPASKRVDVLLADEDPRCTKRLHQRVEALTERRGALPPALSLTITTAECSHALLPTVARAVQRKEPFFAFLDGWGAPDGIPFATARSIAHRKGGEVLVTFQASHLWRFCEVEDRAQIGDRCFGSDAWRAVADQSSDAKKGFLVEAYRDSLRRAGFSYLASFELVDEGGHALHLVFGTNNLTGLERMKEALWKVDPLQGGRFQDPRLQGQMALDLSGEADRRPLRREILRRLEHGPVELRWLKEFALLETIYRVSDARTVVKQLCRDGIATSSDGLRLGREAVIALDKRPRQDALF